MGQYNSPMHSVEYWVFFSAPAFFHYKWLWFQDGENQLLGKEKAEYMRGDICLS